MLDEEAVVGKEVLAAVATRQLEPQGHADIRPGHAHHLEHGAAGSYSVDPLFDMDIAGEEACAIGTEQGLSHTLSGGAQFVGN